MVTFGLLEEAVKQQSLQQTLGRSLEGNALFDILVESKLTSVFQPIVRLSDASVYAFEALTRCESSTVFKDPMQLFGAAQRQGCLLEMDLLARKVAIESFKQYDDASLANCYLFLNVSVQTFMVETKPASGMTIECLKQLGISPERVVIEITELQPVEDYEYFMDSIRHYREMGFKVAIDDLGGGYNGLRMWSEVRPDFVKIDKHFISNIHQDEDKKRFLETLVSLAKGLGTQLIAEGVEVEAELKYLSRAGVDFVQGYLFKRPCPIPSVSLDYTFKYAPKVSLSNCQIEESVLVLMRPMLSISPDMAVSECSNLMLDDETCDFLPVVSDQGEVLGMVWRRELMSKLLRPYGQSLHHRKQVKDIMDQMPLVVESSLSIVELSRMVTDVRVNYSENAFIVIEGGVYQGVGTFNELLRVMTDISVKSAQHANPLSGLPGNLIIHQQLQTRLDNRQSFVVLYVDVDHFKPFNDAYSFEEGDDIIRATAEILNSCVACGDFVGHVGGDDFIVITEDFERYQQKVVRLLERFAEEIPNFYRPEDREQGGIVSNGRDGSKQFFKIMTLSVGVLVVHANQISHTQQLASYATKAKKGAKSMSGNAFYVIDTAGFEVQDLAYQVS